MCPTTSDNPLAGDPVAPSSGGPATTSPCTSCPAGLDRGDVDSVHAGTVAGEDEEVVMLMQTGAGLGGSERDGGEANAENMSLGDGRFIGDDAPGPVHLKNLRNHMGCRPMRGMSLWNLDGMKG